MPSPDVFVIDAMRWKEAIAQNGHPQQGPQLAVEVISRSNRRRNVARKTALYLKNGAAAVWIVYPTRQLVHVFRTPDTADSLTIADTLQLPPPLPDSCISVADFFDLTSL